MHTKNSPMRGGLDVVKNNENKKNGNHRDQQLQPDQATDGSADEVEFGREPGAAADEVVFDEVTPGTPNVFDAVGFSGAWADDDVESGEESADRGRDRIRNQDQPERDVETAAEIAPAADPVEKERERDEARVEREETGDEGRGLGITSIILSVLSFFFVPFLLGSAGIILGVIAGRRGSILGWWAVGLGVVSVILTAFIAPIAGF